MTPYEAGLGLFVDMEKGDFVGRDALVDRDKRPLLFGLTCEGATPTSSSEIMDGTKVVGNITAGVPSPTLGVGIGYARFHYQDNWVGREMVLRLTDGASYPCNIVELPFFDKERQIVRGLDRNIP